MAKKSIPINCSSFIHFVINDLVNINTKLKLLFTLFSSIEAALATPSYTGISSLSICITKDFLISVTLHPVNSILF